MKFHVVQVNEKIEDMSRKYNVSVEEIIKLNRHINNIDRIVPGMKLRLPILSDEVSDQLKESFLDIEKYYPKIENFKEAKIEKKTDEVESNNNAEGEINQKEVVYSKQQQPIYYQNPYYPNYSYQSYNPYNQGYQNYQKPYQGPQQPYQYQAQAPQPSYNYQPYQQQQNYNYQQMAPITRDKPLEKVEEDVKPIDVVIKNDDYATIFEKHKPDTKEYNTSLFDTPATCSEDVELEIKCDHSIYQPYSNYFQNPLYTPPYPCGKPIEAIDQVDIIETKNINMFEFDENVKEIKVDLRDFIKKHTKVKRKKDPLDIL